MVPTPDEIRAARTRARLTRAAFAALIGVSEQTLKKWETGKARPTPISVDRYHEALNKIAHPMGATDYERWRMIREKAGFSPQQMAAVLGATEDQILEWERPKQYPTVEQRARYEDLLARLSETGA